MTPVARQEPTLQLEAETTQPAPVYAVSCYTARDVETQHNDNQQVERHKYTNGEWHIRQNGAPRNVAEVKELGASI